jgi:hypothetical protein
VLQADAVDVLDRCVSSLVAVGSTLRTSKRWTLDVTLECRPGNVRNRPCDGSFEIRAAGLGVIAQGTVTRLAPGRRRIVTVTVRRAARDSIRRAGLVRAQMPLTTAPRPPFPADQSLPKNLVIRPPHGSKPS